MPSETTAPFAVISVQFPDLSNPEFNALRADLCARHPDRVVIAHEAHRWYSASSDVDTVQSLVHALRAATSGRTLTFDDEEALDDLSQEYVDWLDESSERADAEVGPIMSFSVHLPALTRDEFAGILTALRADHPRRIVLGEQVGHSHHELSERSRIEARMPGLRAALRGQNLGVADMLPLVVLLNDYAGWLTEIS